MAPETIADIVRIYASSQPDKAALVEGDDTVTYAELHERSNRVANGLISEGIGAQITSDSSTRTVLSSLIFYTEQPRSTRSTRASLAPHSR